MAVRPDTRTDEPAPEGAATGATEAAPPSAGDAVPPSATEAAPPSAGDAVPPSATEAAEPSAADARLDPASAADAAWRSDAAAAVVRRAVEREEALVAHDAAAEPSEADESPEPPPLPRDAGQTLAAFYDRRAPAALAYCARICEPETIADAVEEAFGHVFAAVAGGEPHTDEQLDELLRDSLQEAVAERAPDDPETAGRLLAEAERSYESLSGDDAPALGRSLLGEMLGAAAEPAAEPQLEPDPSQNPQPQLAPPPADQSPAHQPPAKPRRRLPPGWRRRLAIVLAVIGTLLLAEAVVTLVWKEPFTGYLAARAQDDLGKQLDNRKVALDAQDMRSLAAIHDAQARSRERMSLLARHLDQNVGEGEALGRIQIPKIGVDYVFVQGTDAASLRKGPGHYHGVTKLPGQGGVVGIAGHRTTYEAPFRNVDELKAGDHVTLRMPYGRFTYEVTGHRIVPSNYTGAFASGPAAGTGERLVLSACHPLYSATERILVDAKLVQSQPLGSAVETASVPAVPSAPPAQTALSRTRARLKALGNRQLGPGASGPDVRELQRLLGMPVTGTFDANTTAAVLAFQRDHGLPQVGVVGSQTKRALARRTHPPSTPPTPAAVPQQKPQTTPATTTPYQPPQGTRTVPGGHP